MKKELPELKLNKRTIANLNNMEMRYVVGGGGDDDQSAKTCDENDLRKSNTNEDEIASKFKKLITNLQTRLVC